MSVPDFIARAIEAQGKTSVDAVVEVLRDTNFDPTADPAHDVPHPHVEPVDQGSLEVETADLPDCATCDNWRTVDRGGLIACPDCSSGINWKDLLTRDVDGSQGWPPRELSGLLDRPGWVDEERNRLAPLNGSRPKGDAPDKVFPGAWAEMDFARSEGGVWLEPLKPRAECSPDVRLPDGRLVDVKNQSEMCAKIEEAGRPWSLYFYRHRRMVPPGWEQGREAVPYIELFGYGRRNLVYDLRDA